MRPIEDIYRLTPSQNGILAEALRDGRAGMYVGQIEVHGLTDLEMNALARAGEVLVERHSLLRTSIHWSGLSHPVQIVSVSSEAPNVVQLELLRCEGEDKVSTIAAVGRAERERVTSLSETPLVRIRLLECTGRSDQVLVITVNHIVVDGWSLPLLIEELFSAYDRVIAGGPAALPHVRPYKDYVQWLSSQDVHAARNYWRQLLKGYTEPVLLEVPNNGLNLGSVSNTGVVRKPVSVDPLLTDELFKLARKCRVTMSTLVQAAWALVLAEYSGARDVVFGFITSGRPPELIGVEAMVGLFINTLPFRVQIEPQVPIKFWLQSLRDQQVSSREYEYAALVDIQKWSELEPQSALFDSIIVYQNYPDSDWAERRSLTIKTSELTSYGCVVVVEEAPLSVCFALEVNSSWEQADWFAVELARQLEALALTGSLEDL